MSIIPRFLRLIRLPNDTCQSAHHSDASDRRKTQRPNKAASNSISTEKTEMLKKPRSHNSQQVNEQQ